MNYAWRVDKTNRRRTKVVSIAEARIKETVAWNSLLWPAKHETIRGDLIIPRSTAAGKFNSIGLIADIKSRAMTKIAVAFRARRRNGNGKWTKEKRKRKKRVYRLIVRRDEKEPVVQLDFPRLSSTNDGGKIEKEQRSFPGNGVEYLLHRSRMQPSKLSKMITVLFINTTERK